MSQLRETDVRERLRSQAEEIKDLTAEKNKLESRLSALGTLIERADDLLEQVKDDVDTHVHAIETAVVQQVQAESVQFTHEEVLRYSQSKRDDFTHTSKRIASHASTVSRRKRYRWCRDASASLYWAWGALCLAVVNVFPALDPRPPLPASSAQSAS